VSTSETWVLCTRLHNISQETAIFMEFGICLFGCMVQQQELLDDEWTRNIMSAECHDVIGNVIGSAQRC
jgi:hypothetical protein